MQQKRHITRRFITFIRGRQKQNKIDTEEVTIRGEVDAKQVDVKEMKAKEEVSTEKEIEEMQVSDNKINIHL